MSAQTEIPEREKPTEYELWKKYEQRKAELPKDLTAKEYFDACQKIANELGI